MQFISENRLNVCHIFGRFGFLETEFEPNVGFSHIPKDKLCTGNQIRLNKSQEGWERTGSTPCVKIWREVMCPGKKHSNLLSTEGNGVVVW